MRVLLAGLLLGFAVPAAAADFRALDGVIDAAPGFSGVVLVGDGGGPLYRRARGYADAATRRPHRTGDMWRWASVTKQVTAILTMQEVEAGRLSLDTTIAQALPDFRGANGAGITVRQLLQHSSGLPNPDDTPAIGDGFPSFYRLSGPNIGDRAAALGYCSGPAKGRPGDGFSYNNCDYLVLGAILERSSGRSVARLVRDRIAKPLGLRSLAFAPPAVRVKATLDGKPEPAFNLTTFGAAGALSGTPEDLLALDRALLDGRLLGKASMAALWDGNPKLGYEALGVWSFAASLKGCAGSVQLVERRGEIGGVEVRNIIAPALARSVVVFVNAAPIDFGEVWQGKGLSFDLLSAAFCPAS